MVIVKCLEHLNISMKEEIVLIFQRSFTLFRGHKIGNDLSQFTIDVLQKRCEWLNG